MHACMHVCMSSHLVADILHVMEYGYLTYVCPYVCTYVCTCVCMYACLCVSLHDLMPVRTYITFSKRKPQALYYSIP